MGIRGASSLHPLPGYGRGMRIEEIWRFPVKSVGGERLPSADVTDVGIAGDRAWGLVDLESGLVLTGRRQPELLMASARSHGAEVAITLPDGTETADDSVLSQWLGKDVALRPADSNSTGTYEIQLDFETEVGEWFQWNGPEGSFHDSSRISLVSTLTMRDWDRRRFRTNLVLDGATADSNEDHLVGTSLQVGSAQLNITKQIDRCIMVTRPQPDGVDRDLDVLRTINAERATFLAVGALVSAPGTIAVGDQVG